MAGASDERNAIIILSVLTVVATVVVLFRLKRRRSKGFLGADDWIIVVALFILFIQDFWAYMLASVEGRPYNALSFPEKRWYQKTYFFGNIGYIVHVTVIKIAILISYHRIFGHILWTRYAIHFMTIVSILWGLGAFFPFLFQCKPIIRAYEPWVPGTCERMQKWLWATAISNMIMDWMILLLPIVPLFSLRSQLGGMERGLVFASFALGSLACLATSARACLNTWGYDGVSTNVFLASISTYAEPMIAIISACLPFLPLNYFFAKTFSRIWQCFSAAESRQPIPEAHTVEAKTNTTENTITEMSTTRVIYRISTWLPPAPVRPRTGPQPSDIVEDSPGISEIIRLPPSTVLAGNGRK